MVTNSKDFPPLPSSKTKQAALRLQNGPGNAKPKVAKTQATTINSLPDELILNIFDFLPGMDLDDFHLPSLISLSLTNRRLHEMVADRLFLTYNSHFCEPYLFLRTVSSRPHLAELVQHAYILYGTYAYSHRERHVASAQDKKVVKEGMRKLATPDWKILAAVCNSRDADIEALHTAVLLNTPNIVSLTVRDTGTLKRGSPRWLDVLKKVSMGIRLGDSHQFEKLQSIDLDATHFCLSQISGLWRLNTLRKIQLSNLVAVESENGLAVSTLQRLIPISCNKIEEIVLEQSFLGMNVLRILTASSKKLTKLELHVVIDSIPEDIDTHSALSSMKLCDVLSSQKEFLEDLKVHCDAFAEDHVLNVINLYEGLQEFKALKNLSCPLGFIAWPNSFRPIVECLPSSIITLRLTIQNSTSDRYFLDALAQMAASLGSGLPLLKEIRLIITVPTRWCRYDWALLTNPISETNILFVLEEEEEDSDGFSNQWGDKSTDSSESSDEVSLYSDGGR